MSDYRADSSPLRRLLEDTAAEQGLSMKALTVLDTKNDPFRLDTPSRHRDGRWLATTARELGLGDRKIHLRGLHYAITMHTAPIFKPNGERYVNDDPNWYWLSNDAGKAARWLGYLPFDQIVDQRNTPPVVRIFKRPEPWPYLTIDVSIEIPPVEELMPTVGAANFNGVQPFKLVLFGEKSSLEDVLAPIASEYKADLYLPTGEISDTLLYQMARIGAEDGRPMVVACFSDADPAGWQMPISIARKLQAFRALGPVQVPAEDAYGNRITRTVDFGKLDFQVLRAAITPDQARAHGLPSSPLKETERRGDAWQAAMGIAQTEIDALTTPRMAPVLQQIAREVLDPFYDWTLDQRVMEAHSAWLEAAAEVVTDQLGQDQLDRLWIEANTQLAVIREQVDALKDAMRIDTGDLELPELIVPEAHADGNSSEPLLDSTWDFAEQCRRLIDSKAYRKGVPA